MTEAAPAIVPVIMCGGAGTRLWPLSVGNRPKPFHAFNSDWSLFQETVRRVSSQDEAAFAPPLIVCGQDHHQTVADQLAALGAAASAVVLEPCGRNTAPVAAVAAQIVAERFPDALILLLAADHQIADGAAFRRAVARAAAAVGQTRIVTFGIQPSGPETGYGYIQRGETLAPGVDAVVRFVEKPEAADARAYLESGRYVWNAGIFLFPPSLFLAELNASRPDIARAAVAAIPPGAQAVVTLDPEGFAACPAESIDYAVMEHTKLAAVAPCDIGWADVGSWSEVWRLGEADAAGNVLRGETVAIDASGSLVFSDGPVVAVVGVSDLIVVAAGGGVLVLPKSRAQDVKAVVAALARRKAGPA